MTLSFDGCVFNECFIGLFSPKQPGRRVRRAVPSPTERRPWTSPTKNRSNTTVASAGSSRSTLDQTPKIQNWLCHKSVRGIQVIYSISFGEDFIWKFIIPHFHSLKSEKCQRQRLTYLITLLYATEWCHFDVTMSLTYSCTPKWCMNKSILQNIASIKIWQGMKQFSKKTWCSFFFSLSLYLDLICTIVIMVVPFYI